MQDEQLPAEGIIFRDNLEEQLLGMLTAGMTVEEAKSVLEARMKEAMSAAYSDTLRDCISVEKLSETEKAERWLKVRIPPGHLPNVPED